MNIQQNLSVIQTNISEACKKKNRKPEDVKIIAVTKYVSTETAVDAVKSGVEHIGENRPEGLKEKYEVLGDDVTWHFIGSLQSRKVKEVLPYVDYIHSLDRLSLAKEIDKRADRVINCFVQVNVSGEETKHGLSAEKTLSYVDNMKEFPNIRIVGLMTMAPHTEDEETLRSVFSTLKQLQNDIQAKHYEFAPCTELSMGMSNDYEIAVQEGATFVRIGTSLVGKEF
ncbi:YggS family pyridoxal phosphate-dependent enzyme [Fictibacillus sp. KU28468]|uniref:YggS family pyridoxal phosphate-dependent enzyme n=1 Tax=Fictibacillus sp. KU28468 TaxID=2991053 RepID=UPI00223D6EB4|nr:YggS family pyridoxal phosphate-dependent enzyme [Fictibacillus sp. KU28468]UZJ77238.1 YggS family pyridoxal phosphate-dependent enzyme [Fictibacillus sp. KU28468]